MESVLNKIFENRELRESFSKTNPDYIKKHQEVSRLMDIWKTRICPEDYEKLEELLTMRAEAETLQCLEDFRYGFKLGILIGIEMLKVNYIDTSL